MECPVLENETSSSMLECPCVVFSGQEYRVPEEVWLKIFQHLSFRQLSKLRTIWRYWKGIIDNSPKLMKKFHLRFPEELEIDRDFEPGHLFPARSVTFSMSRISSVDFWWNDFGQSLIHLTVHECQISFSMLLKMLRQTPNLERLKYICPTFPAVCNSTMENITLQKMEEIIINSPSMEVFEVLEKMCPNVKHIFVAQHDDESEFLQLLNTKKDTVDGIGILHLSESIQNAVLQMKQLTSLYLSNPINNETLHTIGTTFPNLRSVQVTVVASNTNEAIIPSFLDTMSNLETLLICGKEKRKHVPINFRGLKSLDKLQDVHLEYLAPTPNSLQNFLQKSVNIRSFVVHSCHFKSWLDLFPLVGEFKQLKWLKLTKVQVDNSEFVLSDYFDRLEYLKLYKSRMPQTLLSTLFSLCATLEELHLKHVILCKNSVERMCQKLKNLEKLTITSSDISNNSKDYIKNNLLAKCNFTYCFDITEDEIIALLCGRFIL